MDGWVRNPLAPPCGHMDMDTWMDGLGIFIFTIAVR